MRYKAVKCDICGKDMTNDEHQYKFKRSEYYECSKVWQKLDMCEVCYADLQTFIFGNNQLRKDGLNPIVATRKIHISKIKKCKKQ